MIRPVLKMGEELLLEKVMPVKAFGTPELRRLVVDMWDTMDVEGGIGIAAPQVGVSLQVICFGTKESEEASGARRVPRTVLINPVVEPVGEETMSAWEGCLSVPGLRGRVVRPLRSDTRGLTLRATGSSERSTGCTPESSSTRPIIWSAFSIRCA